MVNLVFGIVFMLITYAITVYIYKKDIILQSRIYFWQVYIY